MLNHDPATGNRHGLDRLSPRRSDSRQGERIPLLRGTRLPTHTVLSNYEAGSPIEEISDNFDMPEHTIRDLLTYAAKKHAQPHP